MPDHFVMLAPFLLLGVIVLLRFVGCASLLGVDDVIYEAAPGAGDKSTTVALSSDINPSVFGQPVTFTAEVRSAGGTPSGTVTFNGLNPSRSGTPTLNPGEWQLQVVDLNASTSSYSVSAHYTGDFDSSDSVIWPQVVNPASTSVKLTSSSPTANLGQPIMFTAVVSANPPSGAAPTGAVKFSDGLAQLGPPVPLVGGKATTSPTLAVGQHPITALYVPDSTNFSGNQASLTQIINPLPVTHLQTAAKRSGGGTTLSVSLPAFLGSGKLVVACVQWGGAAVTANVTSVGAVFTPLQSDNLNPQQVAIFYATNVVGAITVTATLSGGSSTDFNLLATAYDNVASGSAPDHQGSIPLGTGTSLALSFSTTGLSADDLIYAIAVTRNSGLVLGGSLTPGTAPPFVPEQGQGSYLMLEDYVVKSTDLGPPINVRATNTTGTATSKWYMFAMRIKHA